jgi:hypothetical protein
MSISVISGIGVDIKGALNPECKDGFGGNKYSLASGHHRCTGTRGAAGSRTDSGSFTASDDRAENRSYDCTTARILTRSASLVPAMDMFGVRRIYGVTAARDGDGFEVNRKVAIPQTPHDQFGGCATRNHDATIGRE